MWPSALLTYGCISLATASLTGLRFRYNKANTFEANFYRKVGLVAAMAEDVPIVNVLQRADNVLTVISRQFSSFARKSFVTFTKINKACYKLLLLIGLFINLEIIRDITKK